MARCSPCCKRDATDLVVQKATELGVAALLPVLTERTNAARAERRPAAAIATEAAEQCERLTVPAIAPAAAARRACSPTGRPARPLFAALERQRGAAAAAACAGPAGAADRSGGRLHAGGA